MTLGNICWVRVPGAVSFTLLFHSTGVKTEESQSSLLLLPIGKVLENIVLPFHQMKTTSKSHPNSTQNPSCSSGALQTQSSFLPGVEGPCIHRNLRPDFPSQTPLLKTNHATHSAPSHYKKHQTVSLFIQAILTQKFTIDLSILPSPGHITLPPWALSWSPNLKYLYFPAQLLQLIWPCPTGD